ncbi:ribonuclease Y, partial [Campylobacterota bacterium]
VSGVIGFLISKKLSSAQFDVFVEQAKAKARAIDSEAELLLQKATFRAQEVEAKAQKKFDEAVEDARLKLKGQFKELEDKEAAFNDFKEEELRRIKLEASKTENLNLQLERAKRSMEKQKEDYVNRSNEAVKIIESGAGLTRDEAKGLLLRQVEDESRADIAHIVRRYEQKAKEEGQRKANYIIAQATTRFAGEFASERLMNTVHLNDDELKGRIIGKEGRNIKTLELLLGVDIIIDETPNAIILSSFNLYRRAIATRTIELLIEDGRIQPARIEEIYEKVTSEFEASVLDEGEKIAMDLGIRGIHPELLKLIGRLRYRASYGQNALAHTLEVANLAGIIAAELGGDETLAKRAGLLHDIGKAMTHEKGGNHVDLGIELAQLYKEHPVVLNAIPAHHGLAEIESIECAAVCAGDALSAARPGARREVLESYLKRVTEIEDIASEKHGVKQAYAINAGREVRVIVNAELLNDDESSLLAKEIAKEIESKMNFPGDIKVSVIRESRSIEYAR